MGPGCNSTVEVSHELTKLKIKSFVRNNCLYPIYICDKNIHSLRNDTSNVSLTLLGISFNQYFHHWTYISSLVTLFLKGQHFFWLWEGVSKSLIDCILVNILDLKPFLIQLQCTGQDDIFDNVLREDSYWRLHLHHSGLKNNTKMISYFFIKEKYEIYLCAFVFSRFKHRSSKEKSTCVTT